MSAAVATMHAAGDQQRNLALLSQSQLYVLE